MKYFKNWLSLQPALKPKDVFAYRIVINKGDSAYSKANVVDDVNNCCNSLAVSANVKVSNTVSVRQTDPQSYEFNTVYINPTHAVQRVGIENIMLTGIEYNSNVDPYRIEIKLTVSSDSDCNNVADANTGVFGDDGGTDDYNNKYSNGYNNPVGFADSINFQYDGFGTAVHIPAYGRSCFITHLTVPSSISLTNSSYEFKASVFYYLHVIVDVCDGAGGNVLNPVGGGKKTIGGSQGIVGNASAKLLPSNANTNLIIIYPNPNKGSAAISLPANKGNAEIILYDLYGRTIKNWHRFNSNKIIVSNLSSGMYLLKVIFNDGKTATTKMVVEN